MPGPKAGNVTRTQAAIYEAWCALPDEWLTLSDLAEKVQANRKSVENFAIRLVAEKVAEFSNHTFPVVVRLLPKLRRNPKLVAKLTSAMTIFNPKKDGGTMMARTPRPLKGVLPRSQWPKALSGEGKPLADYHELKGIFLGGCVERGVGSSFHYAAHAHCCWPPSDNRSERAAMTRKWFGWICIRKPERVSEHDLMMHELAHLLTSDRRHDDGFRAMAVKLGGSFRPKRARPREKTAETALYFKLRDEFQVLDRQWERLREEGVPEKEIRAAIRPAWWTARKAFRVEAERLATPAKVEG